MIQLEFAELYNKPVSDLIFCVTQFNILQTNKYEYMYKYNCISINLNCNNEEEGCNNLTLAVNATQPPR